MLDGFATTRTETEAVLISPIGGVGLSLYFPKTGFYLKTGVSYTELNTKVEYQAESSSQMWDATAVSSIIVSAQGDSTILRHGNWATETSTRTIRNYNTFNIVDIPLLVGKEFELGKKWRLGVETGMGINALFQPEGAFLNQEILESPLLQDYESAYYKNNIGWSWIGGVQCNYEILPNSYIGTSLVYRRYLTSFTSETAPVQDKFGMLSANIGIQYRW